MGFNYVDAAPTHSGVRFFKTADYLDKLVVIYKIGEQTEVDDQFKGPGTPSTIVTIGNITDNLPPQDVDIRGYGGIQTALADNKAAVDEGGAFVGRVETITLKSGNKFVVLNDVREADATAKADAWYDEHLGESADSGGDDDAPWS